MKFRKSGKLICALALSAVAVAVPFLGGCNTDHPEAKITIDYLGTEYVLEYKMYRNMYPQTVKHFIELADSGFYDNTIIHDYQSDFIYGGGYAYSESGEDASTSYKAAYAEGKEGLSDYLEAVCKDAEYVKLADDGKLTPSVYADFIDGNYKDAYNTLIGEFSANQHKIDNGALKRSFGSLRMYYSDKSDVSRYVYLDKKGSAKGVQGEYKYNSATSQFSIQTSTSTSSDSSYCIFATLKNSDKLTALRKAFSDDNLTTTAVKIHIDNLDPLVGQRVNEKEFRVSKTAIIVKSVKITKY